MKILAIETSCDETGVSILEAKGNITHSSFIVLADSIASQIKIHREYGGVYPMLAKREHIKNLPILLEKTLKKITAMAGQAKLSNKRIPVDMIAVTSGPGLEPALWTGIVFAKELAQKWNVPLVPVNHMEGHILSVFGKQKGKFTIPKMKFPMLSLLVSGGHTELVLIEDWMKYKVIGETLDDAAGEAFDKVARMLGLSYPGGPEISKLAEKERKRAELLLRTSSQRDGARKAIRKHADMRGEKKQSASDSIVLPRPMIYSKNFDFSFSGLKTAVLYLIRKIGTLDTETKAKIALEFENAVVDTLVYKTQKAIGKYKIKTLIVAGGVSANKHLKKQLMKMAEKKIKILFPEKKLSTDNSVMIGIVGYLQFLKKKGKFGNGSKIKAEGGLQLS